MTIRPENYLTIAEGCFRLLDSVMKRSALRMSAEILSEFNGLKANEQDPWGAILTKYRVTETESSLRTSMLTTLHSTWLAQKAIREIMREHCSDASSIQGLFDHWWHGEDDLDVQSILTNVLDMIQVGMALSAWCLPQKVLRAGLELAQDDIDNSWQTFYHLCNGNGEPLAVINLLRDVQRFETAARYVKQVLSLKGK